MMDFDVMALWRFTFAGFKIGFMLPWWTFAANLNQQFISIQIFDKRTAAELFSNNWHTRADNGAKDPRTFLIYRNYYVIIFRVHPDNLFHTI